MYYVNKIVGWSLSPAGAFFIGMGVSWLLNWQGWRRTARWCAGFVFVLLWVLSCGVTTRIVGVPLERMGDLVGCAIDIESMPEADAIVLLGGGMGAHEKCGSAEMFSGADRVWVAAKLWKACKAKVITLSGGNVAKSTVPLLKDLGVDEVSCVFFPYARNTEEESQMIREALSDAGTTSHEPRILLVTSAWHMPRAKMLFERCGFEVVPCPADFEMSYAAEESLKFGDFFPNAEALCRNSCAMKEWIGLLGYSLLKR